VTDKPSVVEAWSAVMDEVQSVSKTGRNESQGFSFRGIDAVMNAVGPALRKHGVVVVPTLQKSSYRDVEVGRNRTLMREVTVEVTYTVRGPAGDSFTGSVPGESMDSGDKGAAKAMSVAYRTFLLQALTIPTDEPDPDSTSVERAPKEPAVELAPEPDRVEIESRLLALPDEKREKFQAWLTKGGVTAATLPASWLAKTYELLEKAEATA
jgi:hypothetical protein